MTSYTSSDQDKYPRLCRTNVNRFLDTLESDFFELALLVTTRLPSNLRNLKKPLLRNPSIQHFSLPSTSTTSYLRKPYTSPTTVLALRRPPFNKFDL